jgi:hypothetical protein
VRTTVEAPVSPRPVQDEDFEAWVRKEANPILTQLRSFANQREHTKTTLTTAATGVYTTIWSEAAPDGAAWYATAFIVGRATVGGNARAAYELRGLFYRDSGALTQEGATSVTFSAESVAAFDTRFNITSNTLTVQVLDDAVHTMDWTCVVVIEESR